MENNDMEKDKYHLTTLVSNEVSHPNYIALEEKIHVEDLVTFYYYLLYPNLNYQGETHNYYEFFVCLSGKARVKISDIDTTLEEKEYIISRPNQPHTHYPEKTYLSSVSICFSASGIEDDLICDKVGKLTQEEMNTLNLLVNEYINNYEFQGDYQEPYVKKVEFKDEYAYKQIFKCGLEILLVLITRDFQNDTTNKKVNILIEEKEKENKIIRYIKEHYKEKLLLEDIANEFNYSIGHLCRKFKQETGGTIIEYITKYRISIAMRLLFEMKDANIEDIAFEVGFNDVQYFTKAFKKCVGMTPGKYRAEVRETNALHAQDVMFDVLKNI